MRTLILIFCLILLSIQSFASEAPLALHCQEDKHRLEVDFSKGKINLFEYDSFSQKEKSLFGFAHNVSNFRLCFNSAYEYFNFSLNIKNDGQLTGKFHAELDQTTLTRLGMVVYTGWFSWEPMQFNHCVIQY